MAPTDWKAEWAGFDEGRDEYDPSIPYYCADDFEKGTNHPFLPEPVMLRSEFCAEKRIVSARLYVTALGLTRVWINGNEAFANRLMPGVCDFRKRAYCFVADVSDMLENGTNAISAVLADGWYAGYIGLNPRQWWGGKPRLRAQMNITFADGTVKTIATDGSWKCSKGPWLYADIMHGAGYDFRLENALWQKPGFDDSLWKNADTGAEKDVPVFMHPGVPVVEGAPIAASNIRKLNDDECIVDFGKCFSGVVRLTLKGSSGSHVDIYHAEELTRDGKDLFLFGNRSAEAHDMCILRDDNECVFQPQFTYHGFRYAHIKGLKAVKLICAEGIPLSSLMTDMTDISSSNRVINAVVDTVRNTAQCNMVDIVTDVCTRDERLGWGCEGNLFMHTASAFGNNALFLRKWLQDALDGQQEDGGFWAIAPAVMMRDIQPFAGDLQSDIALHCCWLLMQHYDDYPTVKNAYPALKNYLKYQIGNSDRYLRFATAHDWLDLTHGGRSDFDHGYGGCDPTLLGTAWFAMDALMMRDIAAYLGLADEEKECGELYATIRKAFRTFFLGRNHLLRGATQGGYMVAVCAELLEPEDMEAAKAWVLSDMEKNGGITWGTATTPVALFGMCKLGLQKEAAAFICSEKYPSIGYMNSCGATTAWERWDAIYDGCFHPHQMNAFSHIGLATVGDWIVSGLAGIKPAKPGYEEILLEPVFSPEAGSISASYAGIRGTIESGWEYKNGGIDCRFTVPQGSKALIRLPFKSAAVQILDKVLSVTETENGTIIHLLPGQHSLHISI